MLKLKSIITALILLLPYAGYAFDFEKDGIYYNHISGSSNEVSVTAPPYR